MTIERFSIEVRADSQEDAEDELMDTFFAISGVVKRDEPDAEFEVVHEFIGGADRRGRPIPDYFGRRTYRVHPEGLPGHG